MHSRKQVCYENFSQNTLRRRNLYSRNKLVKNLFRVSGTFQFLVSNLKLNFHGPFLLNLNKFNSTNCKELLTTAMWARWRRGGFGGVLSAESMSGGRGQLIIRGSTQRPVLSPPSCTVCECPPLGGEQRLLPRDCESTLRPSIHRLCRNC